MIKEICSTGNFGIEECISILSIEDNELINEIFSCAREITDRFVGRKIYLRGLIEVSNICKKNCYYCGIRRDNKKIKRYMLQFEEIATAINFSYNVGFGSIVLQAGEQTSKEFISLITKCIQYAKRISNGQLGITLSMGEQKKEVFQQWFDAGADRYLLRIETSDPSLYAKLHPCDHSFTRRMECLYDLKEIGYQVGTGVMIGVPHQTVENCARDILFFKEMDVDMIGMGPYIVHPDTPIGAIAHNYNKKRIVQQTLLMIALSRIICRDVNIASTTALEVLDKDAIIKSLYAGANVKMINVTPEKARKHYELYKEKTNPSLLIAVKEFEEMVKASGFDVAYFAKGDPLHFHERKLSCQ
ncbi:MAG: [FeFe] hydrogenase H-cluster radical SAM maturase HydE [Spirochaetes bacterium]|nr:[FeFe] hydrogenase H-cluster radical SAM maturase HydE [Spirochaetota bacterium]